MLLLLPPSETKRDGGDSSRSLDDNLRGSIRGQAFAAVFLELAQKFQRLVDVLN